MMTNSNKQDPSSNLSIAKFHQRSRAKKNPDTTPEMSSLEFAAVMFCATQLEEKMKREKIVGMEARKKAQHEVVTKVRQSLCDMGITVAKDEE